MAQEPYDNTIVYSQERFEKLIFRAKTLPIPNVLFTVNKFGANPDVDAGQTEDIWDAGGVRALPGAAETFIITSSSVNDAAAGTGARTLQIYGLDQDYNLADETVTLNGTTGVTTTTTFINIHRMVVRTTGSLTFNDGNLTATGSDSSNAMAYIRANYSQTQMVHYMIPANFTGFLISQEYSVYQGSGGGSREGEVLTRAYTPTGVRLQLKIRGVNSAPYQNIKVVPEAFPEKTLGWYQGSASQNNTAFSAGWELLCVHNDYIATFT